MDTKMPGELFVLAGIAFYWFSALDIMDGMRARRLRCGSPLGRIIDEALDQLSYAAMSHALGYMFRLPPGWWLFSVSLVNVPFFAMEINHYLSSDLKLVVGEIGPVEVEVIFSSLLIISGGLLGIDVYDYNVGGMMGLADDSFVSMFQVKHIMAMLIMVLCMLFIQENLYDCFMKMPVKTFQIFFPVPFFCFLAYFTMQLPSFLTDSAVVYYMYQAPFMTIILKLMLANMAKSDFGMFHIEYIYPIIPIVAFNCGASVATELLLTRVLTLVAFA
jgi:hypothetical protein